jgi:hypothetical protein
MQMPIRVPDNLPAQRIQQRIRELEESLQEEANFLNALSKKTQTTDLWDNPNDEPKNQLTLQQRFAALTGSWEGEKLQRVPQETSFPSLKKLRDSLPASKISAADLISQMRDQEDE